MKIAAHDIRWIVFGVFVLASLPFIPAPFAGFYLHISPFFLLTALGSGAGLFLWHLLTLAGLVLMLTRKRFLCHHICPTGALCDQASQWSRRRKQIKRYKTGRYLAIFGLLSALLGVPVLIFFDPFNLFYMSLEFSRSGLTGLAVMKMAALLTLVLLSLLFPHLWCHSLCPLGALQDLLWEFRRGGSPSLPPEKKGRNTRRYFLAGMAGLTGGLLIPRLLPRREEKEIRPPFSLPREKMNSLCARCGLCSAVCPTGIISPCLELQQWESFLTPVVHFRNSYCLPECTACGDACPSGAITRFREEDKAGYVMGIARIHLEHCYLVQGRECNLCIQYCAYQAIELAYQEEQDRMLPAVLAERCVGCGACQVVCPPAVIRVFCEV